MIKAGGRPERDYVGADYSSYFTQKGISEVHVREEHWQRFGGVQLGAFRAKLGAYI